MTENGTAATGDNIGGGHLLLVYCTWVHIQKIISTFALKTQVIAGEKCTAKGR